MMANITERDANCKNCLHVRVCTFRDASEDEKVCSQFINKADVVEVRHGKWEKDGNGRTCSECAFKYWANGGLFNYCPNCGAKMDGKGEDDG